MTIFLCENTMEGIFTAVYDAWASRLGHENVRLQVCGETMELFADYREVRTDLTKAVKVARTIQSKIGAEVWEQIRRAALASKTERADAIYRVLILALSDRKADAFRVLTQIQDPNVCLVMELARSVWNETHRYMGFVRFRELPGRILFSEIEPENQVLPLLGEHFADRFPKEHFLILDRTHHDMIAHEAGSFWWIVREVPALEQKLEELGASDAEKEFQHLWNGFCSSISIKERENPQLQRQLWPYKFRKWMTEGGKHW